MRTGARTHHLAKIPDSHISKITNSSRLSPPVQGVIMTLSRCVLINLKRNTPQGREIPGACSDTYVMTYCFRHWLIRYGITSGLHIVLKCKQTKKLSRRDTVFYRTPTMLCDCIIWPLVAKCRRNITPSVSHTLRLTATTRQPLPTWQTV